MRGVFLAFTRLFFISGLDAGGKLPHAALTIVVIALRRLL